MQRKHVRFDTGGTPSPTFSSSTLPSSPGPATPPPLGIGSPYHTAPLPIVMHTVLSASQASFWKWDMSDPSETITRTDLPRDIWTQAATQPAVGSMDIKCLGFPWRITIHPRLQGSYITVADVFKCIHGALSIPVTAAEFDLLPTAGEKHAVTEAFLQRCRRRSNHALRISEHGSGIKRVDFLRGRSEFKGLTYTKEGWALVLS